MGQEIAEYMENHNIHIKPAMFFFLAVVKEMLSEIAMGTNIYINNDHKTYIEEHFKI